MAIPAATITAGLQALASVPWADLVQAWNDHLENLPEDMVVIDDFMKVAAALGVPSAGAIDQGLQFLIFLAEAEGSHQVTPGGASLPPPEHHGGRSR